LVNPDMVDLDPIPGKKKLVVDGHTVQLPHELVQWETTENVAVAVIEGWAKHRESIREALDIPEPEADFEIPDEERNVVGFDTSGSLLWIIEGPSDKLADEPTYYHSVYSTNDNLWARNKNGFSYQLDEQTGNILEMIPANHLHLGGELIEFEGGDVDKLLKHDDLIIVLLDNSNYDDPESRNIFAFTRDGEQLWQIGENTEQAFPTFSNIYEEDGELWAVNMNGYDYRLDWETGEPLDEQYTG